MSNSWGIMIYESRTCIPFAIGFILQAYMIHTQVLSYLGHIS